MYIFPGLTPTRIVLALDTHLLYSYSHLIANQKPFTQCSQGVELTTTKKQIYTGIYTVVGRLHNQPLPVWERSLRSSPEFEAKFSHTFHLFKFIFNVVFIFLPLQQQLSVMFLSVEIHALILEFIDSGSITRSSQSYQRITYILPVDVK